MMRLYILSKCSERIYSFIFVETRVLPNPISQFLTFTKREILLQIRLVKTLLIDVFLVFFAGGVLGALYLEVKLSVVSLYYHVSSSAIFSYYT